MAEDIHDLQANLRQALADWDAAGPDERDSAFARLVPVADDLVEARWQELRAQAAIKADQVREWTGRGLLLVAALLVGVLVLLSASMWWALIAVPLLGVGLYLMIPRRSRG